MITDLLKVKHLITIADLLDPEDYDKLDVLHEAVLSEVENQEMSNKITELYEKYRTRRANDSD